MTTKSNENKFTYKCKVASDNVVETVLVYPNGDTHTMRGIKHPEEFCKILNDTQKLTGYEKHILSNLLSC